MHALEAALLETAAAWEQEGCANGAAREVVGAVDATCLARLIVVCMDLATGSLLLAEVADDRPSATWKALVEERLTALGPGVLSLGSDRAQALMQRAEQGLECLSMPEFFPGVHALMKSYARARGRHLRHAQQDLTQAQEALAQLQARPHAAQAAPAAMALVETKQAEGQPWEESPRTYRHPLETLSLTLHPCRLSNATPQTSEQVARQWHAAVEAMEALASRQQ
jgi:hypothetical protein